MFERLLVDQVWLAVGLCVLLYLVEDALALTAMRLYHAGAKEHLVYADRYGPEGVPTPLVRTRLLPVLAVVAAAVLASWWLLARQRGQVEVYVFLLGGIVLLALAGALRHARTALLFRHALQPGRLTGQVTFSRRAWLAQVVADVYAFALVYALAYALSGSWFFLGGALTCFIAGSRGRDLSLAIDYTATIDRAR